MLNTGGVRFMAWTLEIKGALLQLDTGPGPGTWAEIKNGAARFTKIELMAIEIANKRATRWTNRDRGLTCHQ